MIMVEPPDSPVSATLEPPRKSVELEDPGAHDLESSDHEDVFSDASELRQAGSGPPSLIPMTRVERVDDEPSHGEIPGTKAFAKRSFDAVPDELEVIPEGRKSRSRSSVSSQDRPSTPGGAPIPKTVVTKVDSEKRHGEIKGTMAASIRSQDANPDEVEEAGDVPDLPTHSSYRSPNLNVSQRKSSSRGASPIAEDGGFGPMPQHNDKDEGSDAGEGFGDEFDDFEEGAEIEGFGDFDDESQPQPRNQEQDFVDEQSTNTQQLPVSPSALSPLVSLLNVFKRPCANIFEGLLERDLDTLENMIDATNPYLDELFSTTKEPQPSPKSIINQDSIFLTDRSLSLWSQLVAPPPLQPPNWVRSRIRRMFLVSLGVPVDLDEILPASKQKKLVLPSTQLRSSSRSRSQGRRNGSLARVKQDNASSTSVDKPNSNKVSRRKKGPLPPPELDLDTIKQLCAINDELLTQYTEDELQTHMTKLETLTARASKVLEYWLKRKDNALGDKDAFEGVIGNLVKHARRVRK